jgi:hypothetical protein
VPPLSRGVAPGQARPKGWSGRAGHFADWHGVAVLLEICAHRLAGQSDTASKRITSALGIQDPRPQIESGDKEDDDSEQTS